MMNDICNRLVHPRQSRLALRKGVVAAILPCAVWICLATTTCLASEWRLRIDENPQYRGGTCVIDEDPPLLGTLWHFSIDLGERPVGKPEFVASQYDFGELTEGFTVTYDVNGGGYSDDRSFLAIAPTLFLERRSIHGWDVRDLNDGTFSGMVCAGAELTAVYIFVQAQDFVPVYRPR